MKLIYSAVNERLMFTDENGYEAVPNTEELFQILEEHCINFVMPDE